MKHILNRLIELSKRENERLLLSDEKEIDDVTFLEGENCVNLSFIDGGNQELIKSSNFAMYAFRVCVVDYLAEGVHSEKIEDFYALISFNKGKYNVSYSDERDLPSFFPHSTLTTPIHPDFGFVAGLIRRLSELRSISKCRNENVIIDGSLICKSAYEESIVNNVKKKVYGLSKTNTLISSAGKSLNSYVVLKKIGKWYADLGKRSGLYTYYLKLNENSKHLFRLDSRNEVEEKVVMTLMQNSTDPVFYGYPYGLILADQLARISNNETELIKTNIMVELGESWKDVEEVITTSNAHEILDRINY